MLVAAEDVEVGCVSLSLSFSLCVSLPLSLPLSLSLSLTRARAHTQGGAHVPLLAQPISGEVVDIVWI